MLKVAVLCSRRAPGLDALLAERGNGFDVSCVITSHAAPIDAGVPVIWHPIRRPRRDYDASNLETLRAFGADLLFLLGYTYIVSDVLLDAFPSRIFNIHDSDLTLRRADGERRYVGLHSTLDAILGGEKETRSSLHLVTEKVDAGPVIALSRAYPVAPFAHKAAAAGHIDIVKAYAYAQREWMMRDSWGELVLRALACVEAAA